MTRKTELMSLPTNTHIKTRLCKLEHKLEILIDGFTALAQELDKVKRARHVARPPQDRKKTTVVVTTPILALTTAGTTRMSTSRFQRRTVIPKTMPTPLAISTTSFVSGRSQNDESSTKRQAKFSTKMIQPISTRRDIETNFTSKTTNIIVNLLGAQQFPKVLSAVPLLHPLKGL